MTFDQLNQAFDAFCKWTFNTSVQATALIALVWLAQWLFGKRLPPRWRYALSVLVVLRLILPVVPSSDLSLFNLWNRSLPSQSSQAIADFATDPLPAALDRLKQSQAGALPIRHTGTPL